LFKEGMTQCDDTPPSLTCTFLKQFKWEIFEHPPHGPDLAPCDCHLFLHLETFLAGQSLKSVQETKGMQDWLKGLAVTFFNKGIQKLGDYVEK
jgi:hypothetical protein